MDKINRCNINLHAENNEVQIESLVEDVENAQHYSEFGLASKAPIGSEGIAISPANADNDRVVIAIGGQAYPQEDLEEGETTLYNHFEATVELKKNKDVVLNKGEGNAVTHAELLTELKKMQTRITNLETHILTVQTALSGAGGTPLTGTSLAALGMVTIVPLQTSVIYDETSFKSDKIRL